MEDAWLVTQDIEFREGLVSDSKQLIILTRFAQDGKEILVYNALEAAILIEIVFA